MNPLNLPPMPDVAPTIRLEGLQMELMLDVAAFSDGQMVMRIADCESTVRDGDQVIGSVGCAIRGPFYVEIGGRLWGLSWKDLFLAAQKAESEQYLADRQSPRPSAKSADELMTDAGL